MPDQNQPRDLQALWEAGTRQLAVHFFRRALAPELSLLQVLQALQFPQVRAHLPTLCLRDLGLGATTPRPNLAPGPRVDPCTPVEGSLERSGGAAAPRARRKYRTARQQQQVREALVALLEHHRDGLNTNEVVVRLRERGISLDLARAHLLLKGLQSEQRVDSTRGRPKTWRLRSLGRRVPDPVIIVRRAEEQALAPAAASAPQAALSAPPRPVVMAPSTSRPPPGATAGSAAAPQASAAPPTGTTLLSKAEVEAAARALRARFFPPKST